MRHVFPFLAALLSTPQGGVVELARDVHRPLPALDRRRPLVRPAGGAARSSRQHQPGTSAKRRWKRAVRGGHRPNRPRSR